MNFTILQINLHGFRILGKLDFTVFVNLFISNLLREWEYIDTASYLGDNLNNLTSTFLTFNAKPQKNSTKMFPDDQLNFEIAT